MRNTLEDVASRRPDLRALLYILPAEKKLEWLHAIGPGYDDQLRALFPALPPLSLRSIVAAPEEEIFLWTGAVDISCLAGLFEHYASPDFASPWRALDFGCGCGRLTRFLNLSNRYMTVGSDVNPDHVAWCAAHLPNIISVHNDPAPPLSLPDGSIDFAYSLSVFSHLPEHAAVAWLRDLARVIAPGGILIITTHGATALNIIKTSKIHHAMFRLNEDSTQTILDRLKSERLIFVPYEADTIKVAKVGGEYGNSFIAPDKIEPIWADLFETLTYQAGGLRGWQDIFVLRRRRQ